MKVQCEYCNSWIDDTDEKCPNCGGVNKAYKRTTDQTPKTIEELKQEGITSSHVPLVFTGMKKVSSLFIRIRITGSVPSAIREPMKLMR